MTKGATCARAPRVVGHARRTPLVAVRRLSELTEVGAYVRHEDISQTSAPFKERYCQQPTFVNQGRAALRIIVRSYPGDSGRSHFQRETR